MRRATHQNRTAGAGGDIPYLVRLWKTEKEQHDPAWVFPFFARARGTLPLSIVFKIFRLSQTTQLAFYQHGTACISPAIPVTLDPMSSRPDTNVMHHSISALLTDDELAQLNAKRPPRDKIKPTKLCGARTSTDGSPCQDKAGAKTKHKGWGYCAQHGGNTPAGNRYAARLMGEDILEKQRHRIEKFGGDRNDPSIRNLTGEQVLIEEVRRSAAMVRWLEDRIGEWDFNSDQQARFEEYSDALGNMSDRDLQQIDNLRGLPALVTETSRGIATTTDQAEWLRIYRDERINLAKIAKMCIDAGIAYRMVAIAEDQGRVLSSAMRAVIDLLNLNQQQLDRIPQIVPPILRAVASGEPIPSREQLGLPA